MLIILAKLLLTCEVIYSFAASVIIFRIQLFVIFVQTIKRDENTICVVEDIRDVLAIEKTVQFNGLYHVLGGIINPY